MALTWSNVDLNRRRIMLEKTKTNERRVVPINNTLLDVLEKIPRHKHSDLLFPDINPNMITVAFGRVCEKVGIANFRFHDLRHTFASHLTMAGLNQRTVQHLLGHSDPRMTSRCSHLSDEYLQDAVKKLDTVFNSAENDTDVDSVREILGHFLDT